MQRLTREQGSCGGTLEGSVWDADAAEGRADSNSGWAIAGKLCSTTRNAAEDCERRATR